MKDEELRPVIRLANEWRQRGKPEIELSKLIDPDNRRHNDFLSLKRSLEVSGLAFMTCAQELEEAIQKMKTEAK